jgi:hypothetical protein
MRVFKPISALVVGFSAVALSVPAFATTESARVVASKDDSVLDQCIAKQRKLSALFLIDESKSLEKTDPDGDRVPALRAAARAIYSLTRGDENTSIDIEVGVAGFAADFILHKDWMTLNDESLEEVLEEIDKSKDADRHSAVLTRYHVGLQARTTHLSKAITMEPIAVYSSGSATVLTTMTVSLTNTQKLNHH